MPDPILSCRGVDAGYNGRPVVRAFDLDVAEGEIVALLGPNGAGKTTILMTLAGLLPVVGGRVDFAGRPVLSTRPERNARRGLVLVPDSRELVTVLSARENLLVARRDRGVAIDDVLDMFPGLRNRLEVKAGALSGGEQQMLALARALVQRPRIVLIDELSLGLAPRIRNDLIDMVRRASELHGMAAIVVEQHVDVALQIADRAVVLIHGDTSLEAPAAELLGDRQRLERAYLGA